MGKTKKTDLKKVVKKAKVEDHKNPISDFKVHTTKPIIEPKNKRKKPKGETRDGTKKAGKKGQGKTGVKPKPKGIKNKADQRDEPRRDKTELPRVIKEKRKFWPHEF